MNPIEPTAESDQQSFHELAQVIHPVCESLVDSNCQGFLRLARNDRFLGRGQLSCHCRDLRASLQITPKRFNVSAQSMGVGRFWQPGHR